LQLNVKRSLRDDDVPNQVSIAAAEKRGWSQERSEEAVATNTFEQASCPSLFFWEAKGLETMLLH
jgi:hypothetical protein